MRLTKSMWRTSSTALSLPNQHRDLRRVRNTSIRAYACYLTESNRIRTRRLHQDVKYRLDEARNKRWESYLKGLAPSHQACWRLAKTRGQIPCLLYERLLVRAQLKINRTIKDNSVTAERHCSRRFRSRELEIY